MQSLNSTAIIAGMKGYDRTLYEALFELSHSLAGHNDLDGICSAPAQTLSRVAEPCCAVHYLAVGLCISGSREIHMRLASVSDGSANAV